MYIKYYKKFIQIGLNVLYYRKQIGITQLELAELAETSRNNISRIETGAANPTVGMMLSLAEALQIPVEKLFEDR